MVWIGNQSHPFIIRIRVPNLNAPFGAALRRNRERKMAAAALADQAAS